MGAIIPMQVRDTLTAARLRVVKRLPQGLVLTDGRNLCLYVPADIYARHAVVVLGKEYRYARRVRAVEL